MSNERELTIDELDAVSGGTSDLGKYITKAVDDAIGAAVGGGPPEVWVGCAWVPQWW
jgi:bacteriocin-like protein